MVVVVVVVVVVILEVEAAAVVVVVARAMVIFRFRLGHTEFQCVQCMCMYVSLLRLSKCVWDWKCSELIPFLYFALSLLFLSSSPLLKEKDNKLLLSVSLYSHKKEGERKRERHTHKKNQRVILVHSLTHIYRYSVTSFFFWTHIHWTYIVPME